MSRKKKTTAQSKRPRKAPSNQTGGTAWGKKAAAAISGKMQSADVKKLILLNFPYIIAFYMVEKAAWLYRHCNGDTIVDRLMVLFMNFGLAYKSYLPSFHPFDLMVGLIGAAALKAVIYFKGKNAKKYRQGEEYGSARWGNAKDIEPFIDPVFENNVLLTQTERLMMSGRPKHPKYARNKNVIVIGGSGSGKTRFFIKPNLMQMPEKVSYVCTDPKGTIIIECGKMLSDAGYKIKVLNTINFKKSMHYNPFHYIRSEKDILKLVNTIIANTKGDGEKSGEDFWVKAERLLYCALIGYIYYLKQGDIKVIMVKDLSRLGRDYIGVGDYIEQIFPLMGVRFIAVNNSFDSMKLNNGTPGIEVAVSNLVNNMYSRDIAKKIRAALETNWKNGKATCTNVPFGYVWNKKGGQRWEIDPEAAPCVKKVFELALSGRNTTQIAYGMNELNLPTPGLYAKRKNLLMGSNPIIAPDSEMLWNAAIVWRILRRYEYTGALVMGRRKKIDVNTTSVRTLPEDKWIIAENAHAAIVTRDEYYQAQKAIRNVTPIQYKVGDDFALKGKICCGNCNRQLRHERQYGEMVFYCGYKRSAGKFSKCYGGYYREHSVNAKVARAIKTVFYALDVVNQGMQEKQSITVRCVDIEDLEKQAEAIRVEQIKLYESYADGVLLRDAYIEKKKALSEKLAVLQDSIRTEKEEQECADELDEEIRALTKQASEKTYIGGLTKECVDAFVSMVYLYDDQTMKIEFNCEDVIRRALEKYGA